MSDFEKLLTRILQTPECVAVLTDSDLVALFYYTDAGIAQDRARAAILAEAWVRKWLYIGVPVSADFELQLSRFSPAFKEAYATLAEPWRRPRAGGDPYPSAQPPAVVLDAGGAEVWQWFWKRLCQFARCDGLVAIADNRQGAESEAVAIPFTLRDNDQIQDERQQAIRVWSEAIRWLQDDGYQSSLGASLAGVFPDEGRLSGESIVLPILLARERTRAAEVPEYFPLEILATGGFRSGALQAVGGMAAKEQLALRLGTRHFFHPGGVEAPGALAPGLPFEEVVGQVGAILRQSPPAAAVANQVIDACSRQLAADDLTRTQAGHILRRLIRLGPLLPAGPERNACTRAISTAAAAMRARAYHVSVQLTQELIASYRKRPFHGREPLMRAVDQFLASPAGVLLVTGRMGHGKTALMTQIVDRLPAGCHEFRHFFSLQQPAARILDNFYSHLGLFLAALAGRTRLEADYTAEEVAVLMEELRKSGSRVVILIDGIDEADGIIHPHFFQHLPAGVHVIASARSAGTDQSERYLPPWLDLDPQTLSVENLEDRDLAEWLSQQPEPLCTLGRDEEFRRLLHERAEGSARFVADLVAHLARIPDLRKAWRMRLAEIPADYIEFIRRQYAELKDATHFQEDHEALLGLLCAADGELSAHEIQLILGKMPKLPLECDRWVSAYGGDDGEGNRYTLQTVQIGEALRAVIPWVAQERALRLHCDNWATHESRYSLRCFARHFQSDDWQGIATRLLDRQYRATVGRRLPDEPDLPMRIMRSAFERAVAGSNWVATAGLMLARADLGYRMLDCRDRDNDPLERRAAEAAEILAYSDRGRSAVLRLLQAWTLKWKRFPEAAVEEARQHLDPTLIASVNGLEADIAATLLLRVFESDDKRLLQIAPALLDEPGLRDLVGMLANKRTDAGFKAARQLLRSFPQTRRRAANAHYDKAVNALTMALAEDGRWDAVIAVSEELLPRQATLNLVEAGRVAAGKGLAAPFEHLRDVGERMAKQSVTTKDRNTCRGNLARLGALLGMAHADPIRARAAWDDAGRVADGLKPEQRFHVMRELTFATLETVGRPRFYPILAEGNPPLPVRYFQSAVDAWREMSRNDDVTKVSVAHGLAKLIRLAVELKTVVPRAVEDLDRQMASAQEEMFRRTEMLNAEDRDRLWLRLVLEATEAPRLDFEWAVMAARNISDHQIFGRAVAKLVARLYHDGRGALAKNLGNTQGRFQQSVRLATGLALLDYDHDRSTEQLLVRILPRAARASVQEPVLRSELAAALARDDRRQSNEQLQQAFIQIRNYSSGLHSVVRFRLNVIEAAVRAGAVDEAKELFAEVLETTMAEATRLDQTWECRSSLDGGGCHESRPDNQADFTDMVDSLCAIARTQWLIDRRARNPALSTQFLAWEALLQFTWRFARERVPGISTRTGALAEVAETASRLRWPQLAERIFEEMHHFIHKRLDAFGKQSVLRERETCLGEMMLGLLKARFYDRARSLKPDLLAAGTGPGKEKIQDTAALHALAWLNAENDMLGRARLLLPQIKSETDRAKCARNIAVTLARKGYWKDIASVSCMIVRIENNQKYRPKILEAVVASKRITASEKRRLYADLLWDCSSSYDAALQSLSHLVRHQEAPPLAVVEALEWALRLGSFAVLK